ncbi:MAG: hypothetical protein PUA90_05210 [bacterium]|nr:hypothetical protein [bacterium]
MNKKIYILLIGIIIMFNSIIVKADVTAPLIDVNYNNVYKGDVLDLKIGFDYKWFDGIVKHDENYDYIEGEEYSYKAQEFAIKYDPLIFDINLDSMIFEDEDYYFIDYDEYNDGSNTFIIFNLDIKRDFHDADYDGSYDGKIDDLVFSNIKLKVKDDVELGKYFIETGYYNLDEKELFHNEKYPITIINHEENENTISNISFYTYMFEPKESEKYILNIEPNKYNYEIRLFKKNNNLDIYTKCNSKCKISGIGSDFYNLIEEVKLDDNNEYINYIIDVEYEDGTKEKYIIHDYYSRSTLYSCPWTNDLHSEAIVIIGHSSYASQISNYVEKFNQYISNTYLLPVNYYEFDTLNDVDREIILLLKEGIDVSTKPYIAYLEEKKIVYEYSDFINNDSDFELIVNKGNNNSQNQENNEQEEDNNTKEEKNTIYDFISKNLKSIIITSILLILILIIIIISIKNKKLKNKLKQNNSNNKTIEESSNNIVQPQEEQLKKTNENT